MKNYYLKMLSLGIIILNACAPNNTPPDLSTNPGITISVGCKLITGGDNGKVVIPAGITLVTGGEDCK